MKCFICTYALMDNSHLERQHDLNIMLSNLSKVMAPKYGPYSQHHIKWDCHLTHSKTWSALDQPANVVYAVCLQLEFPIISMYSILTNHNCSFVLNWCCGLIWSIVHDYDFCCLHLSENNFCFRTANGDLFICKTTRNEVGHILS